MGGLATECNKLSTDEKRQLVEWTIEDVGDRVPVSVTVSENTLKGQRSAIDHAHGADDARHHQARHDAHDRVHEADEEAAGCCS